MLLHGGVVAEMTLCVTFGAPGFGPIFRYIWRRPEFVMFCTISETAAREMEVSVTFGAPRSAVAVTFWCGPTQGDPTSFPRRLQETTSIYFSNCRSTAKRPLLVYLHI